MTAIDTQGGGNGLDQRKPFMSELTVQRGIEPELILVKIEWFYKRKLELNDHLYAIRHWSIL